MPRRSASTANSRRRSDIFAGHLRWAPVIALGYVASILVHLWLNAGSFQVYG